MCRARLTGPSDRERSDDQHRECDRGEYKWILRRRLVDDRRKYSAHGDTEQHAACAPRATRMLSSRKRLLTA